MKRRFLCCLLLCVLCAASTTQGSTKLLTLPENVAAELTVESQPLIIIGEVIPDAESIPQKVISVQLLDLLPHKEAASPTNNSRSSGSDNDNHSDNDNDSDRIRSSITSSLYKIQSVMPAPYRTYINSQPMRQKPRPFRVVHPKKAWNSSIVQEIYPETKEIKRNTINLKKRKQQKQQQKKERDEEREKEKGKEKKPEKEHEEQRQPRKLIFLYNQPTLDDRIPSVTLEKTMEVHLAPGGYPVYYMLAKTNGHFGKTPLKSFSRQQDFENYLVKRREEEGEASTRRKD